VDVIDEKFAEENPNSRFRLLNVPVLAPGTCILCKSAGGDGRQFIDLGIQHDWYGALYFCTECITEAAVLLGMAPKANWELAEKNLQAEISKLDDLYLNAKAEVRAARTLLRNCHCEPISNINSGDVVDVEAIEESESNDSESDESSSVEGSGDVSEASGDIESYVESVKRRGTRRKNPPAE
jgi:hypothetical protein